MVNFDLTDPTGLMIPFSYEVIKDLPNDHVTSLVTASAHISLYVADVQIIEQPLWTKLLKIVQVVLFLMALITGQLAVAEALKAMIKQIIISFVVQKIIVTIAKKISPELAFAVAIFAAYYLTPGARAKGFDFQALDFNDIAKVLENLADIMSNVILEIAEDDNADLLEEQTERNLIKDAAFDDLEEKQKSIETNLLVQSYRAKLLPMMANDYYNYFNDYQTLAFEDFEYDNKYDQIYEKNNMLV